MLEMLRTKFIFCDISAIDACLQMHRFVYAFADPPTHFQLFPVRATAN